VAGTRARFGVLGGVVVLALLSCGIGYFAGGVPFPLRHRGEIQPTDLCDWMGDRHPAQELRNVLPARGRYSWSGEGRPRSRDDTSWQAHCIVTGDGDQLLYTSAELGWDSSAATWLNDPTRNYADDEGPGETFRAGSAAVVMDQTAQILVPCLPRPGSWPYHLVIEVHASRPLTGSTGANRHALTALAVGTARAAHHRAGCTLAARIPTKADPA
jgi:hypothetical protein